MTENPKILEIDLSRHLHEGGTVITNLSGRYIAIAEQAVKEYGDPWLVVHDKPSDKGRMFPDWKSLHWLGSPSKRDFSRFWRIFERIEAEQSNGK